MTADRDANSTERVLLVQVRAERSKLADQLCDPRYHSFDIRVFEVTPDDATFNPQMGHLRWEFDWFTIDVDYQPKYLF